MKKNKLRILILLGPFPTPTEHFILNLITGLIDLGHDVSILTLENQFQNFHTSSDKIGRYNLQDRTVTLKKFYESSVTKSAIKDVLRFPGEFFRVLRFLRNSQKEKRKTHYAYLKAFLGTRDFDIIHVQFGLYAKHAFQIKKLGITHAKIVCSLRGYDVRDKTLANNEEQYRQLFSEADMLLPVSSYFKKKAILFGAKEQHVKVLRSGIDISELHYNDVTELSTNSHFHIISIGRLVEKKGHIYLLKALVLLRKKNISLALTLIGDGPLRNDLMEFIARNNLSETVEILPFCSHKEIQLQIKKHHILIHPSVKASDGDEEGVPNVIKEAMALGRPVIATRHSGIPELIEDGVTGYLCDESSPESLANGIEKVISDFEHGYHKQIINAAREFVIHHYDNRMVSKQLETYYQEVLA